MKKKTKIQKTDNSNRIKKKNQRGAMYLSTFLSFCFLALGFGRYKDIKTKGYYLESKYQVVVNGNDGLITVYALFVFGFGLLVYSIYLLSKENNQN
jgi:hypothetical protein